MLYLTCTMVSNVDLAYYGASRAKDWVSVDCSTTKDSTVWSDKSFYSALKVYIRV